MSGRLVILPKKTYCPWNPDNVERVLRDERLAKEQQEQQAKAEQQAESKQRWDRLKPNNPKVEQRFSLFAEEEKQHAEQQTKQTQSKQVGILPVFLGESLAREAKRKAAQEEEKQGDKFQKKQAKRKLELDPMKNFARESEETRVPQQQQQQQQQYTPQGSPPEDNHSVDKARRHSRPKDDSDSDSDSSSRSRRKRRKRRRKHKHKHRNREDSDSSDNEEKSSRRKRKKSKRSSRSSSSPSIDYAELRKRRLEREEKEKLREQNAIQEASGVISLHSNRGHYQNQFFPRLSRN